MNTVKGNREGGKASWNAYQTSIARTIWNKSSGLRQLRLAPTAVNNKLREHLQNCVNDTSEEAGIGGIQSKVSTCLKH